MMNNNDQNINPTASTHYDHEEDDRDEFMDRQSSFSDVTHGSDESSASVSQPKKKKAKVEEASSPGLGAFTSMIGDPNMLALGSMGLRPAHPAAAFNPNFNLAFGTGLPPLAASYMGQSAAMQMGFPGTSPGFHAMGGHPHAAAYGYGPGFAMAHHPHHPTMANGAGGSDTPDAHSNSNEQEGIERRGSNGSQPKPISGMTPLMFAHAGMTAGNPMVAHDGSYHPTVLQVVSTDSQNESMGHTATTQLASGYHVVALQQPKRWVRWSDHEDQVLRRSVEQWGDNNFRLVSEQMFHGTRSEVQCKNRWKKALQPGLVKGRWTREEDNIITQCVAAGNKWSEISKHLPGRIGEQIKERWVNVLDPEVRKGVWTEPEMKLLRDTQKELGNKWSEIAKRIPGRSENSVKNRWYNQKTSDRRAKKKKQEQGNLEQAITEENSAMYHHHHHSDEAEQDEAGPMMHIPPHLEEHDHSELYEPEEDMSHDANLNNVFNGQDV